MNRAAVDIFHAMMKKGWIDRRENPAIWAQYEEPEVLEDLEVLKAGMQFDIVRAGDRAYLVPTQDNDLFLKNNMDFRNDTSNQARLKDLYLMNYLAIYLLYLFFSGDDTDPQVRTLMSKEAVIEEFTKHCKNTEVENLDEAREGTDYSENFRMLASDWLSKIDGDVGSWKLEHRYGILNRLLNKFKADGLMEESTDNTIRPSRKLKDLMPYVLRKSRIQEIQNWVKETADGTDQEA